MKKACTYFALTMLFFVASFGCKKDKDYVPYIYVDEYINASDPAFSPLNAVMGYIYWQGGSKGLIIFRKGLNEFVVYDRHCPYKVDEGNQVQVEASGLIVSDATCTSKFSMSDGSANAGPATKPLKQYEVSFDGTVLHIFN